VAILLLGFDVLGAVEQRHSAVAGVC